MKKYTVRALGISALISLPLSVFASSDREEIEQACRQAAIDEGVTLEETADYIADCVVANLVDDEDEGSEEQEAGEKQISE